jgi:dihydrofolate synthase/folylpolyglutamate synthase
MDFDEAVNYLLSLGHETLTIKLGLRTTELLLQELGNPQQSFTAVQIAGTNGKGSTAAFLDSICRNAGIRTGLYTSPHLQSITERIKIDGVDVSTDGFARCVTQVKLAAESLLTNGALAALPTFFEQVTAVALVAFREAGIHLAILETGLGGRLDSTTAANARICAITQLSLDHEEYLGNTIEDIAAEKAAIIRAGSKVVIAKQQEKALAVILQRCEETGVDPIVDGCSSTIVDVSSDGRFSAVFETKTCYEKMRLSLRGRHQVENAAVAIQLAEVLNSQGFSISQAATIAGVESASHPGRLEFIGSDPTFLLDGAHNPAGALALHSFLKEFAKWPLTIVFGAMRDKRLEEIAEIIFPIADNVVLTTVNNPRAATTDTLISLAERFAPGSVTDTSTSIEAIDTALDLTPSSGMICITGSLYLIGETRQHIQEHLFRS